MTKEEALAFDLALEALEKLRTPLRVNTALDAYDVGRAITAIKQVRALDKKAENARELGLDYEPVAWSDTKQSELNDWFLSLPTERQAVLLEDKWMLAGAVFLAGKSTPPAPAPVPLTDEQIDALWEPAYRSVSRGGVFTPSSTEGKRAFARAIEAAHGITEKGQQ
jgi:hypothetical protein